MHCIGCLDDVQGLEVSGRARVRGCAQRGFSLLEIMLVMALIAIIGVLAGTAMTGGIERMQLRSSAKEIASALRHARARAIATTTDDKGDVPSRIDVVFTGAREVQPASGTGAIMFFSDGASTGGRVQLRYRDAAWNIEVGWLIGDVSVRNADPRT
jgi:general secretion pathway protein H